MGGFRRHRPDLSAPWPSLGWCVRPRVRIYTTPQPATLHPPTVATLNQIDKQNVDHADTDTTPTLQRGQSLALVFPPPCDLHPHPPQDQEVCLFRRAASTPSQVARERHLLL